MLAEHTLEGRLEDVSQRLRGQGGNRRQTIRGALQFYSFRQSECCSGSGVSPESVEGGMGADFPRRTPRDSCHSAGHFLWCAAEAGWRAKCGVFILPPFLLGSLYRRFYSGRYERLSTSPSAPQEAASALRTYVPLVRN